MNDFILACGYVGYGLYFLLLLLFINFFFNFFWGDQYHIIVIVIIVISFLSVIVFFSLYLPFLFFVCAFIGFFFPSDQPATGVFDILIV